MSMRKDSEDYLGQLREQGYKVTKAAGSSHWQIRWEGRLVTTQSSTPGGGRGLDNLKATIRRFERARKAGPPFRSWCRFEYCTHPPGQCSTPE
jgi:hypothetical protein